MTRRLLSSTWISRELLTRIGTVFQQPEHQFVESSVRDELAVGLRALHWRPPQITRRTDELLATLHLTHLAGVNPFTLSGGEQRRLSVGTVLATSPEVIFLDEPTFGQDRNTWLDLVGHGRDDKVETTLHQDRKSTRLNSSHQLISYAVFCLKKKNNH